MNNIGEIARKHFKDINEKKSRISRVIIQIMNTLLMGYNLIGISIGIPVMFGVLGISSQIIAILLLFKFLKDERLPMALEKVLNFLGISYFESDFQRCLELVAIVTFFLLAVSTFGNYFYQKYTIRMSNMVEKKLILKLIFLCQKNNLFIIRKIQGVSYKNTIIRCVLADSRAVNRFLQVATTAFIPIATLLVSLFFLVYLNWHVSLMMLPVILLYGIGIFRVNDAAIKGSHRFDVVSSLVRKKISNSLYQNIQFSSIDSLNDYINSYFELVIVPHRSSFVNDFIIALILSLIPFAMLVNSDGVNHENIAKTLAYLIALRYVAGYLKQFSAKLSIMNRFYPQISRLKEFLAYLESEKKSSGQATGLVKFCGENLQVGKAYIIENNFPVDRYSILAIINDLVEKNKKPLYRNVAIMTKDFFCTQKAEFNNLTPKEFFFRYADKPETCWLLVDNWSLRNSGISVSDIEKKYPDKFILYDSIPCSEDIYEQRKIIICKDDKVIKIDHIKKDLTPKLNSKKMDTEVDVSLSLDDF